MSEYRIQIRRGRQRQEYRLRLGERLTVLDALFRIQAELDATLTFRCACRVGMCGTCAMMVNGQPRLACRTRLATLPGPRVRLAPLAHFPVVSDLVVAMTPFFQQWRRALPGLRPLEPAAPQPRRMPPDALSEAPRDCITCGICYAACGVVASQREYLGPAAIQRAAWRLHDPRDGAGGARRAVLEDEATGIWRCHTQYACTEACPKGLDLTATILRLKRGEP